MKTCTACKLELSTLHFSKDCSKRDGLRPSCKACQKAYALSVADERAAYAAEWRKANAASIKDYSKRYWLTNGAKTVERVRVYRQLNKAARAEAQARRRARSRLAKPAWADVKKIKAVYELAREFIAAGIPVHVDHIIPLKGVNVCGLHVENNLRVCLAMHNLRKKNAESLLLA